MFHFLQNTDWHPIEKMLELDQIVSGNHDKSNGQISLCLEWLLLIVPAGSLYLWIMVSAVFISKTAVTDQHLQCHWLEFFTIIMTWLINLEELNKPIQLYSTYHSVLWYVLYCDHLIMIHISCPTHIITTLIYIYIYSSSRIWLSIHKTKRYPGIHLHSDMCIPIHKYWCIHFVCFNTLASRGVTYLNKMHHT